MAGYFTEIAQACQSLIERHGPIMYVAGGGKVQGEAPPRKGPKTPPRPPIVWTAEITTRVVADYQNGVTIAQIERDTAIPRGSIHRKLVALGVLKIRTGKFKKRYS